MTELLRALLGRKTENPVKNEVFGNLGKRGVSASRFAWFRQKTAPNAPGKTGKFHPAELVTTCHRFAVEQWID